MGYHIRFDGGDHPGEPHGPFTLATASGWALFAEWAESLPADAFPSVRGLAETGYADATDSLARELGKAVESHPPAAEAVRHTAMSLLDQMGVGHPDESAAVVE